MMRPPALRWIPSQVSALSVVSPRLGLSQNKPIMLRGRSRHCEPRSGVAITCFGCRKMRSPRRFAPRDDEKGALCAEWMVSFHQVTGRAGGQARDDVESLIS
jgi:hypothetical protein